MKDTSSRYTAAAYIKDRALFMAAVAVLVALLSTMLAVMQVSPSGIALIGVIAVCCAALCFAGDYLRQRKFWRELEETASCIDAAEYFADMLECPTFLSGAVADEACRRIARCAADEICQLKADIRANREYTELWVHEAKTPVAAAKLILDKMHGSDVANLKRELERTENLVEQALFSARSSTLTNDYLIREIPLADIARAACKQNMHYLTSLGVSVDIDISPAITVFADKTWLAFILSQVITNAAKYDSDTISFTAQECEKESPTGHTVLKVQDNGCGIPEQDVPRVFDRGFTGEVGRAHGSATGMGLYLAARLCAQMGLAITLASEVGAGTRVEISFPHDRRRAQLMEP